MKTTKQKIKAIENALNTIKTLLPEVEAEVLRKGGVGAPGEDEQAKQMRKSFYKNFKVID